MAELFRNVPPMIPWAPSARVAMCQASLTTLIYPKNTMLRQTPSFYDTTPHEHVRPVPRQASTLTLTPQAPDVIAQSSSLPPLHLCLALPALWPSTVQNPDATGPMFLRCGPDTAPASPHDDVFRASTTKLCRQTPPPPLPTQSLSPRAAEPQATQCSLMS